MGRRPSAVVRRKTAAAVAAAVQQLEERRLLSGITFQSMITSPAAMPPNTLEYLATTDFNSDSKADVVVSDYNSTGGANTVNIALGNGDGPFHRGVDLPAAFYPAGVAIGDFNSDGKPDVAVA